MLLGVNFYLEVDSDMIIVLVMKIRASRDVYLLLKLVIGRNNSNINS